MAYYGVELFRENLFIMPKTIVINSGYFNPIHPGHIECMTLSKKLGDELWMIVNTDLQAEDKRGVPSFQTQDVRLAIVYAIKPVDRVYLSIDADQSVCQSILKLAYIARDEYGEDTRIIFAKGGDRSTGNSPETLICNHNNIEIIDGLGAKTHSSSDFIKNIQS
jgi:cytidyltransferase-like protein